MACLSGLVDIHFANQSQQQLGSGQLQAYTLQKRFRIRVLSIIHFYNLACVFVRPVLPCLLIILAVGDMKKKLWYSRPFFRVEKSYNAILICSVFVFVLLGFLSRNYWSSLYHDLMASSWEKANSILARNLNSGHTYLITAVQRLNFQ